MKLTAINPHFNACDQQWELMPEQSGGRRCGECERVLVDFTPLSEQEVLNKQRENDYKLCGRYTHAQIDRLHRHLTIEESKHRRPWLISLAMGVSSMLPFTASAQDTITEATNPITESIPVSTNNYVKGLVSEEVVPLSFNTNDTTLPTIPIAYTVPLPGGVGSVRYPLIATQNINTLKAEGVVTDKYTGEPLPFSIVSIAELNLATTTDWDGKFEFSIPRTDTTLVYFIKVQSIGYIDNEYFFSIPHLLKLKDMPFRITMDPATLTGLSVTTVISSAGSWSTGEKMKYWSNPANWYRRAKNKLSYK